MAKIILRARPINNYIVETKTIDVTDNKSSTIKTVELTISASGKIIDAKDFTFGVLPSIVSSISYYNTNTNIDVSNRVIAVITFNDELIPSGITNLNLPISGLSRSTDNTLILTDITNVDDNVFVSTFSIGAVDSTNTVDNYNVYKISSSTFGPKRVLIKKFSLPIGYIFEQEPNYNINGSGYKVSVNVIKDSKGTIKEKSFEIFYNFPQQNPSRDINNSITFSATSKVISIKQEDVVATKEEEYKIYNVDLGRTIGTEGGVKNITINGVPGSKFKIQVHNTAKQLYDFKGGGFRTNPNRGFLEGTIPPAKPGFGFGTFNAFVKVDPSTTADTITTTFTTAAPTTTEDPTGAITTLVPDAIEETVAADVTLFVQCVATQGGTNRYVIKRPLLTTDLENETGYIEGWPDSGGGASVVYEAAIATNELIATTTVGAECRYPIVAKSGTDLLSHHGSTEINFNTGATSSSYYWIIETSADAYYLNILRKPKFKQGETYVDWDDSFHADDTGGENEIGTTGLPQKVLTSAGVEILTDVEIQDWDGVSVTDLAASGSVYTGSDWEVAGQISVSAPANADVLEALVSSKKVWLYTKLIVSFTPTSGTFGDKNLNLRINVDNFLRLVTPD